MKNNISTIKRLKKKIEEQRKYIDEADLCIIRERIENKNLKKELKQVYTMIRKILEDAKKTKMKEIIKLVEDE